MLSTLRMVSCFKKQQTPQNFFKSSASGTNNSCCWCSTQEETYRQPYEAKNKFHLSACKGKMNVILKLLEKKKYSIHHTDKKQRTALHFASYHGRTTVVQFLLLSGCGINVLDDKMMTPLVKAIQSVERDTVSLLLQEHADPNLKDIYGQTALHHAIRNDTPSIVAALLDSGCNMEEPSKEGLTPLMLALQQNKLMAAAFLITSGANVHLFDQHLRTTLMFAVKWDSEHLVRLLLKKGVDLWSVDIFGWNALDYAHAGNRKVVKILESECGKTCTTYPSSTYMNPATEDHKEEKEHSDSKSAPIENPDLDVDSGHTGPQPKMENQVEALHRYKSEEGAKPSVPDPEEVCRQTTDLDLKPLFNAYQRGKAGFCKLLSSLSSLSSIGFGDITTWKEGVFLKELIQFRRQNFDQPTQTFHLFLHLSSLRIYLVLSFPIIILWCLLTNFPSH
ncbi:POTE ankyrin domain family member A-like [Cricetulus griseus]|uniref:POTE ankyrin domain family member A-like n=1 Tax=Cricetulus griseus TaxID=10029 RepID=A0A9J7HCK8_CRIGR|nr:POTE ankyrin domain family member A-like [Cricetulus griseus]